MTGLSLRAAEIENDMQQTKRENECGPGEEYCAHCGEPHEEGDMYRLGGDGDWMCVPCIVGCSQMYSRTRGYAIRTATALQVIGGENCKAMADEALTFLEGR